MNKRHDDKKPAKKVPVRQWLALGLFITSLACCPAWAGVESDTAGFIIGVQTHFPQGKNLPAEKTIRMIKAAGVASLRDEIYWFTVEQKRGIYAIPNEVRAAVQLAINNGIKPLIILDYGNKLYQDGGPYGGLHGGLPTTEGAQEAFVNYAKFIANSFKGQVVLYEIWNEWNIGAGPQRLPPGIRPDPQAYVDLLCKTYRVLKAIDDNIIVIGGAVAGYDTAWITELLDRGAIEYMDALSIHPYSYRTAQPKPEKVLEKIADIHRIVQRYTNKNEFPIYITEIGWPSNVGAFGINPEIAGDYLARFLFLAKCKPFIKGVWWYDFQNDGTNIRQSEDNFGLVQSDFTPKPAYSVLKDIAAIIRETAFAEQVKAPPHLWALRFAHLDGRTTLALWSDLASSPAQVKIGFSGDTSDQVLVQEVGSGVPMGERKLDPGHRELSLSVSGRPWLIQGTFGQIILEGN